MTGFTGSRFRTERQKPRAPQGLRNDGATLNRNSAHLSPTRLRFKPSPDNRLTNADVAKLVDARDLKSLGHARAGSTPAVRTSVTC